MLDQATPHDKIYLIRVTSSLEVRSFLDRQPEEVKANSQWLREALIREFAGPESEQGITVAMDVKQGKKHPKLTATASGKPTLGHETNLRWKRT